MAMVIEPQPQPPSSKKQKIVDDNEEFKQKVFEHIIRNSEIPGIEYPPMIDMPKTFQSLLVLCYASERDSDSDSNSSKKSSGDSSSESDDSNLNNSPRADEWSHIKAEDGSLRFDRILPLLPPVELSESRLSMYHQTLRSVELALAYYNRTNVEGPEYELVAPLMGNFVHGNPYFGVRHVNFLAKPKNTNLPPQLFFAEVVIENFLLSPDEEPVLRVTIIPPNPHLCGPSPGANTYDCRGIIHPKDMICIQCAVMPLVDSDDSSSETSYRAVESDDDDDWMSL